MPRPFASLALAVLAGFGASPALAMENAEPPWEASPTAIQRAMATDPGVVAVKDSASHFSYRGGTLAGQPVHTWRYTLASGGRPPQLAVRLAPSETAFSALYRLLSQTNGSPDEFHGAARRDALWTPGPSLSLAGEVRHILLTDIPSGPDARLELTFFDTAVPADAPRSQLRYFLHRDPHPTPAQLDAYRRIADAMDGAVRFYEKFTVGIVKTDFAFLDSAEATAEGNINGNVRFGPTDISLRTALHEMSHTVGIGTTPAYHRLTVNERFIGKHALAQLRAIIGDDHAILHADTWHFWPYGLNNPGEDHSIWDYVYHCQMVSAILQDCRELR